MQFRSMSADTMFKFLVPSRKSQGRPGVSCLSMVVGDLALILAFLYPCQPYHRRRRLRARARHRNRAHHRARLVHR